MKKFQKDMNLPAFEKDEQVNVDDLEVSDYDDEDDGK